MVRRVKLYSRRLPRGYDEQTYASPYRIVRYPHQARYKMATDFLLDANPSSVLDYGAGDGHLFRDAFSRGFGAASIVAYEPVEEYANKLRSTIAAVGRQDQAVVCTVRDDIPAHGPYEIIMCLGVLEHMPINERFAFYEVCEESLAPGGLIVIDVPIEVGPTLLVKECVRIALKGRSREYSWPALFRAGLGAITYDPARFDPLDGRSWINSHRGFDYRLLRQELAARFVVVRERCTPVSWLPASVGNQDVFFTVALRT